MVAVGLTDVASRLAISCFKLYEFWESLQGAPTAVEVIKTDLVLLSNILQDLSVKGNLAPSVSMVLKSCQVKVEVSLASWHHRYTARQLMHGRRSRRSSEALTSDLSWSPQSMNAYGPSFR
jgi:hypothetical protein